jgi:pyruvate dehydrogenase E2 component (dihydrolipoamide acetyltransferase)/2-oxoisovalerate dehydrogenase E2 component (dihydrolipoyl transacylase)
MDFALPEIGEGVYEAELVRWLATPGTAVKMGQPLLEVMTDKATMEVPSPFSGTIDALVAEPGQTVKVGAVLLRYSPSGAASLPEAPRPEAPRAEAPRAAPPRAGNGSAPAVAPASVKAAPSVRHLARQLGVDLATLRGSGPGGRILIEDLRPALAPATPAAKPAAARREPALDLGTAGTRTRLTGLRKRIAERMVTSKRTIPHYSYVDECDFTALTALRAALKDHFARAGVKLTILAFVIKAAALALKEVPLVNASLDEQAGEVVQHSEYNIGVAVATPGGLIVPVVRAADRKDIGEIAREVERLSDEARAGRSKLEDLKGGTFTVTSIGGIGGLISTPVINHPEVGILGLGKVVRRPVYGERGELRPADIAYLSFSFDHRVVDGAVGAVFGNAVIRHLLNPAALLLPLPASGG